MGVISNAANKKPVAKAPTKPTVKPKGVAKPKAMTKPVSKHIKTTTRRQLKEGWSPGTAARMFGRPKERGDSGGI